MTLSEAIRLLEEGGVPDAAHDAREIFSAFGNHSQSELIFRTAIANEETEKAILRRAAREPLQYILGYAYFYRERYKVTEDCLIPRQETELLVDLAVKLIPKGESFLDLCTGSGCIAVSVLKNTRGTKALAVDVSEKALKIAAENAAANGVDSRVEFISADVLSGALKNETFAVLSNPPYVTQDAYLSSEPEIFREPKIAFLGGEDGADFYRRIVELYRGIIKKDGFILFEIGYDQGDILRKIAELYGMTCEIIKDYSSLDRIALLKLK